MTESSKVGVNHSEGDLFLSPDCFEILIPSQRKKKLNDTNHIDECYNKNYSNACFTFEL